MPSPDRGSASYRAVLLLPHARTLFAAAMLARLCYGLMSRAAGPRGPAPDEKCAVPGHRCTEGAPVGLADDFPQFLTSDPVTATLRGHDRIACPDLGGSRPDGACAGEPLGAGLDAGPTSSAAAHNAAAPH